MKTLYLIRHGQASAGTSNYDRLSPLGQRQAKVLGEYMLDSNMPPPEEIWSGSLLRQQQTAELFRTSGGLSHAINTDQRLNEYDHRAVHDAYHPEGPKLTPRKSSTQISSNLATEADAIDLSPHMPFNTYEGIIRNWIQDNGASGHYRGESWSDFRQRTLGVLLDIANASSVETLALFTSGGVISVIANQLAQHPEDGIPEMIWNLNNGSITTIQYQTNNTQIQDLNNIEHFEAHPDKSLLTKI